MREKLKEFFAVPANIRQEFWQDTVQKNRLSLIVISIMIFGMELFNMARVLFLSNAGLGTWNNRIYFSMYCILFLSAAVYLLLQYMLRNSGEKLQWRLQIAAVAFFCFAEIFSGPCICRERMVIYSKSYYYSLRSL